MYIPVFTYLRITTIAKLLLIFMAYLFLCSMQLQTVLRVQQQ